MPLNWCRNEESLTHMGSQQTLLQSREVTIAGTPTRALEVAGTGPTVVFLHGFSDSADTWRPVLAHMARLGRRAVAVDLPGFGTAGRLPRYAGVLPPLDGFVDELVHAYDEGEECVIAGNSLGAVLALRAAERDLPLVAAAAVSPAGLEMAAATWRIDRALELLRFACRGPLPPAVVQRAAAFAYGRYGGRGVDPTVAKMFGGHFVGGLRDVRRLGALARVLAKELRSGPYQFDRVRIPLLLLWGNRDQFCLVSGAQLIIDAVPGTRLVVLDNCGHLAHLEVPDVIAAEIASLRASAKP
jgi:pimeloyl-ACP methyl ester carboxylesterase